MGALTPSDAALVEVAAALAAGRPDPLRRVLAAAAGTVPAVEVEEVILQSYLFLGFPTALEGMRLWREVRGAPHESETDPFRQVEDATEWRRRGERLCRRIYGRAYARLRANVSRLHPALDRWMVEEGYGKVFGRPGLDPARRELCNVASLAASGHERQLHSHLRGALQVGAGAEAVGEALERGLGRAADPAWGTVARRRWEEVRRRATAARG